MCDIIYEEDNNLYWIWLKDFKIGKILVKFEIGIMIVVIFINFWVVVFYMIYMMILEIGF